MTKYLRSILAAFLFFAAVPAAHAQYRAIAACPGAVALQPAGSSGATALVDVNGNLCISGAITPSGIQNVTGTGTAGTAAIGIVTVQGIAGMIKLQVTPDSVALPANQSVNVSQINAVTPLMGNGVTGPGSQRVTIASDNTAFSVNAAHLPSASTTNAVAAISSSALAANQIIKASPGNLYSFEVSADSTLSAAAWWVMIYDATAAPADGAITPKKCYAMALGVTSYAAAFPMPIIFATGITIGVSTTGCYSKTASTHAFISGDAQ